MRLGSPYFADDPPWVLETHLFWSHKVKSHGHTAQKACMFMLVFRIRQYWHLLPVFPCITDAADRRFHSQPAPTWVMALSRVLASSSLLHYYSVCHPHMPIVKVCIYHLLFLCVFVRLRISPARIKLTASNFNTADHQRPRQGISLFWGTLLRGPCACRFVQRAGHA